MAVPSPPGALMLVVVAHPDDETFACGSLLLRAAVLGARTVVVCASRGERGEVVPGVDVPGGLAALREVELRSAARVLRVDEVEVLDFEDSGMAGEPALGSLCGSPVDRLDRAVAQAVRRHHPTVVVTLDGSDGHRDHARVRQAVERALHGTDVPLYAHSLPRSLMHRWVLERARDASSATYVDLPEIGTPDDQITTTIDTSVLVPERLLAIREHRSQRSPFDELTVDLRDAFLGREHLVRLNPPWVGGEQETGLRGLDEPGSSDRASAGAPTSTETTEETTERSDWFGAWSRDLDRHDHSARCWWDWTQARWACAGSTAPDP